MHKSVHKMTEKEKKKNVVQLIVTFKRKLFA